MNKNSTDPSVLLIVIQMMVKSKSVGEGIRYGGSKWVRAKIQPEAKHWGQEEHIMVPPLCGSEKQFRISKKR